MACLPPHRPSDALCSQSRLIMHTVMGQDAKQSHVSGFDFVFVASPDFMLTCTVARCAVAGAGWPAVSAPETGALGELRIAPCRLHRVLCPFSVAPIIPIQSLDCLHAFVGNSFVKDLAPTWHSICARGLWERFGKCEGPR